jgi:hypothetical protein
VTVEILQEKMEEQGQQVVKDSLATSKLQDSLPLRGNSITLTTQKFTG